MSGEITLEETVEEMNDSLMEVAEDEGVSVEEIQEAFGEEGGINNLDDVFNDGGEIRCERYADLAWDYASQFGEFAGEDFEKAKYEAIKKAMASFGE